MSILGVDIGGTRIKAGVVSPDGVLLTQASAATPLNAGEFEQSLRRLVAQVTGGHTVSALGIGCKGVINNTTTVVESLPGTLHFLEGRKLTEVLGASIPVAADNDARAALAGELMWGAARGKADVLMLTLGTGIGGGVVSGGRLLRGHAGIAGHLGHITLDVRGPVCICGNRGCLETQFSAAAIEAEAHAAVARGCASRLTNDYQASGVAPDCEAVFRTAAEGDALARQIVQEAIERLGAGIAGLIHLLDPEIVILGGQISQAGEALFGPLRREIEWRTRVMMRREIPLVPQQLGEGSAVLGAAALTKYVSPGIQLF